MSNWPKLESARVKDGPYASTRKDGFNGMFRLVIDGHFIRCIASDGMGFEHVSVTEECSTKPLSWSVMCKVKDLFWDEEDWCVQYHPAKSAHINNHPGCLHIWRPLKEKLPIPDPIMVGIKFPA
jgi:hypothetical protein